VNELRITYSKEQVEDLKKHGINEAMFNDVINKELEKTPGYVITHPSWRYLDKYEIDMLHADNFRSEGIYMGEICALKDARQHLQDYFRAKAGEIKIKHCA